MPTDNKEARSSVAERCFDVAEVSGSIPLVPTSLAYGSCLVSVFPIC